MVSVCYVLPSAYPSGGNKMAVEHVKRLAKKGVRASVSIISRGPSDNLDWLDLDGVNKVHFCREELEKFDYVTATYWETYYSIKRLGLKTKKCYFVQSKEEDFEQDYFRKLKVLQSLMDSEFQLITEAKWIQLYLKEDCKRDSVLIPNHVELPENLNLVKKPRNKPILLVEGEATTSWKNIVDGARVSVLLKDVFETWLLTNTKIEQINPNHFFCFDKVFSCLSWKDSLELIFQADILYRPSLLEGFNGAASEAMCLGTPTILNDIPATFEMGINNYNTIIVRQKDVFSVVSEANRLIKDVEFKDMLVKNAKRTALENFCDWDKSINKLLDVVYL